MRQLKKRTRGSGSIFRKPIEYVTLADGGKKPRRLARTWTIQFYKDGKRIREATGLTNWAEAQKILHKRLNEVDEGKYIARPSKVRITALYDLLKQHNEVQHKNTLDMAGRWKHLAPAFGEMIADRLMTEDLNRYIAARRAAHAADATINRELATLRRMFNVGLRYKKLAHFDTRNVFFLLPEKNVRTGFVEDQGFTALLKAAEKEQPWVRLFLELAYTYAWRKGELIGLRVGQVNFLEGVIRLDPGTTKNGEGREVPLTRRARLLLGMACARKSPNAAVFTDEKGSRVRKDFRSTWRRLLQRAGLGSWVCKSCGVRAEVSKGKKWQCSCGERKRKFLGLRVHDMRRSGAKAALRAGAPWHVVKQLGGWKTDSMLQRYAIVSEADKRSAVEALERARAERESRPLVALRDISIPFVKQAL